MDQPLYMVNMYMGTLLFLLDIPALMQLAQIAPDDDGYLNACQVYINIVSPMAALGKQQPVYQALVLCHRISKITCTHYWLAVLLLAPLYCGLF